MPLYQSSLLALLSSAISQLAVLVFFLRRVLNVNGWLAISGETIEALRTRGVTTPEEFSGLEPERILATVRWYDEQNGRVGPGVLVAELRAGGKGAPRNLVASQDEYAERIVAWLRKHFPELDRPHWGPHPAAVAEVIRLHYRHGKGRLTKREHGPEIRAAVARWEDEHGGEG